MAQYDGFADFYNRDWGIDFHSQIESILDRLLLHRLAPGDSILDIGCGTGQVAARLAARGFRVTGIDQSEAMLEFARANAPGVEFLQADARDFRFDREHTAAIATFDALNHLIHPGDLARCFESAARAVATCFVFDMNRETAFEMFWNGENTVEQDGIVCHLRSNYDPHSRIATCIAEIDGQISQVQERYYDVLEIESIALAAGFSSIRRFDARRDLGMSGSVGLGRFFYQCFR